jgi:hypothetical protein
MKQVFFYLWCHPVWRSDERVSSPDGSVQLSADSEVDELDLGVVGQQNVLAFDVAMNDLAGVKVG